MTQVFLTHASTSPWTVPSDFMPSTYYVTNTTQSQANYFNVGSLTTSVNIRQTFVMNTAGTIQTVLVAIAKQGAPTDNVTASIYDSTGSTLLGTSDAIVGSTIDAGFGGRVVFTFSTPVSVAAGTYSLIIGRTGAVDGGNFYNMLGNSTGAYGAGNLYRYDSTVPQWVQFIGASLNFEIGYCPFLLELQGPGGNGAAGTTGTSGNGGGGGCGGAWWIGRYRNFLKEGTEINPGWTKIPFLVSAGGGGSPGSVFFCDTVWTGQGYQATAGNNGSGITGGGTIGGVGLNGAPFLAMDGLLSGWYGGKGGNSAATSGGGGGGGGAGPNASQAGAASGTGGTGGSGGSGGNGWNLTNPVGATSATGGAGGTGQTAGGAGGAGSNAVAAGSPSAGTAGGSTDTEFDASHGCGGGGGGCGSETANVTSTTNTGGAGGKYGGGGGGCGYTRGTGTTFTPGVGGEGLIYIRYTSGTPPPTTQIILTTLSTSPFTFPGNCAVAGHTVEMLSAGGAGATGTTTVGGGGGGGGGYYKGTYLSGSITPGTTTIAFLVSPGSNPGTTNSQWGSSTNGSGNRIQITSGAGAATTTGGAGGGTLTTVTPAIAYTTNINNLGGTGGNSGTSRGGGGGGGAAGPLGVGGAGGGTTGTAGGGGGGSNNGTAGNGASTSTGTHGAGGQGSSGTPGSVAGNTSNTAGAGTGSSGGSGGDTTSTVGQAIYSGNGGGGTTIYSEEATWDNGYGVGGGSGGLGANTASTGTNGQNPGFPGLYGCGCGGWGYSPSNTGGGTPASTQGLIILGFPIVSSLQAPLQGYSSRGGGKTGPPTRYRSDLLASPLPVVAVSVTVGAGTLPMMGVGYPDK